MRRRNALPDPEVAHALRELDAALAGEPGADPELTDLAVAVRAARPEADPAFLASLDARVHAGFPRPADAHKRRRRREIIRWLPAAGFSSAVAAGLVVLVVSTSGGPTVSNDSASRSSSGKSAASNTQAVKPSAADNNAGGGSTELAAPVPTRPTQTAAAGSATPQAKSLSTASTPNPAPVLQDARSRLRKVERAAQLTLTPAAQDVQSTADGVIRETESLGGYVQRSQVSTTDRGGSATFTLRVPSARLDDAIARLSKLAHVGALAQNATDITGSFNAAASRLDDARAERRALLRALGRASTDAQIAALRARLRDNRARIAADSATLDAVRHRANFATVDVEIEGTGKRPVHHGGGAWTPRDALHDAGRVLEVAGGVALVALAVLLPLGLLALLSLPLARTLRRRRREAVLDQL
jgi:hypothetical protein